MPHVPRLRTMISTAILSALATSAPGQESPKVLILPGERLTVAGRPAFIFLPPEGKRGTPQPWVIYAPTLAGYPDSHEKWMHERFVDFRCAIGPGTACRSGQSPT